MKGSNRFKVLYGETFHVGIYTVTGQHGRGEAMDKVEGESRLEATSKHLLGFLTNDVTTDGPSLEKQMLGYTELPNKSGDYVAVESVQDNGIVEIESEPTIAYNTDPSDPTAPYLLVTDGTGAISAATAKDTELSLQNGRWRVAQSSDVVKGIMLDATLDPVLADTNIRCRIRIVAGYVKS